MASVNKTLSLTWKGVEYNPVVTMRVIDRIEEELNLMQLVQRVTEGDVRFSHVAKLVSLLLQSAGCPASQEEVFEEMFGDGDVTPHEAVEFCWKVFAVIFPEPKKKSTTNTRQKKAKAK